MDALTISVGVGAVTLIIALCVYVFKVFTRETTFEEAYGKNALKLLTEEKLQKAKAKVVKGKKSVGKTIAVKEKPTVQEKHEVEAIVAEDPENEIVEEPVLKSSFTANTSQSHVQSTSDAVPPASTAQAEPVKEEVSEDTSTKKQKKKNRPKKADADLAFSAEGFLAGVQKTDEKVDTLVKIEKEIEKDIEQPAKLVHVNKLTSENPPQTTQQKQPAKQEVADNISMSDVIKRLRSMKSLEPEYAAFLSDYADLSNFREAKLQDDIDLLKKQNMEKEKSVKQVNAELNNSRTENSKLKSGLKEQYDKYETFEQTVRSKLTEIMQLKDENKRLNAVISENQQKNGQYQQLVREVEVMRTELAKKSSLANEELIASKKQIEKLQADNAEISKICRESMAAKSSYENELGKVQTELQRVTEQHAKEHQTAQQQIAELTGEMERAFAIYADANKSQNFQFEQAQTLKSENEKLNSELNNLKAKCQHSDREIEQSNASISQYKNHINQLAVELQEVRDAAVANKENEKVTAKLEEQNAQLTKQLDIAQKKLGDFEEWHKKSTAEKAKADELAKKNQELEAEIQKLSIPSSQTTVKRTEIEHIPLHITNNTRPANENWNKVEKNGLSSLVNLSSTILVPNLKPTLAQQAEQFSKVHKIEWPIKDWTDPNCPKEINICGSYWGWKDQQPMEKTATGFCYPLELPEDFVIDINHPFLFKFVVDGEWQVCPQLPISSFNASKQNENTKDSVQSAEIQEQLEQQKKKNQELRDSNYKLLETVQNQELTNKKMLAGLETKYETGLKEMVAAAAKNLKQALPNVKQIPTLTGNYSIENLGTWLQKLTEVIQQQQDVNVAAPAPPPTVPSVRETTLQKSDNKEEVEKLKKSIAHYKSSLQQVKNQLNLLERVAEEVDTEQRAKIAQLEKALEKFGLLKSDAATKPEECCSPDSATIHELHNVEVKSSGSEEWEVVGEAGH
uniref:Ribosome-binding protein 1 n=1 Tax=Ditylenchus dipsaci TaxID=166011 RepID=A0A915D7R2_9BILA